MSGNNINGYGESKRYLLGLGDLYIDNVWVGNLKETVALTITRNYAYQRAGNNIADQKGEVTMEEALLTASVCDFKVEQLRKAFGIDQAIASEAKIIRKREIIKLVGVDPTALAETSIYEGFAVAKLDRSVDYVSGTDYRLSGSPFEIAREGAGAMGDGDSVIVEYNFSDTDAKAVVFGGETKTPNTFELIFTHQDSAGKYWQIRFFVAMTNTEFATAFNEKESGDYTVTNIGFKALIDPTRQEGQNLLEVIEEDGAA